MQTYYPLLTIDKVRIRIRHCVFLDKEDLAEGDEWENGDVEGDANDANHPELERELEQVAELQLEVIIKEYLVLTRHVQPEGVVASPRTDG